METNNERLKDLVKYVVLSYVNNDYKVCSASNNGICFKRNDTEVYITFYPYWHPEINYCDIKFDEISFNEGREEKNALCVRVSNKDGMTRDMKVVLSPVEYAMVCEEATKLAHEFEIRLMYKAMSSNKDSEVGELNDLGE